MQRSLPTRGVFTESRETQNRHLENGVICLRQNSQNKIYFAKFHLWLRVPLIATRSLKVWARRWKWRKSQECCYAKYICLWCFHVKSKSYVKTFTTPCWEIKKINDCFLIDVELKNESFVLKSLKCFSNFINRDYSAKPWNRHSHFTNFIKPKQNHSLSLKDYWFNRLNGYALGNLCHIDDIAQYLEQYTVINGISILDRGLTEIEVLNLIYAAITLVGIHILKPFLRQENQVFYLTNIIPEIAWIAQVNASRKITSITAHFQIYFCTAF